MSVTNEVMKLFLKFLIDELFMLFHTLTLPFGILELSICLQMSAIRLILLSPFL
jgi:hypothetical protein